MEAAVKNDNRPESSLAAHHAGSIYRDENCALYETKGASSALSLLRSVGPPKIAVDIPLADEHPSTMGYPWKVIDECYTVPYTKLPRLHRDSYKDILPWNDNHVLVWFKRNTGTDWQCVELWKIPLTGCSRNRRSASRSLFPPRSSTSTKSSIANWTWPLSCGSRQRHSPLRTRERFLAKSCEGKVAFQLHLLRRDIPSGEKHPALCWPLRRKLPLRLFVK